MMKQYLNNEYNNSAEIDKKSQVAQSQRIVSSPTIAYKLFQYREELRKPQGQFKLSKSKLNLTQELVSHSVDRITEYGVDELMVINRQIFFSRKLKCQMDTMRQMQKTRSTNSKSPQKIRSSG